MSEWRKEKVPWPTAAGTKMRIAARRSNQRSGNWESTRADLRRTGRTRASSQSLPTLLALCRDTCTGLTHLLYVTDSKSVNGSYLSSLHLLPGFRSSEHCLQLGRCRPFPRSEGSIERIRILVAEQKCHFRDIHLWPTEILDAAVPEQAGDVLSIVRGLFNHDGLFAPRGAIWSASRTYPATQRRSGTVANAARCGAAPRASGRRVKARNSCRGMPAFGQPFCASVQEIVWDLPTSLPDFAAGRDRKGPFVRNEQLAGGNCGADRIYRSSRAYPDVCKCCWRNTGEVAA